MKGAQLASKQPNILTCFRKRCCSEYKEAVTHACWIQAASASESALAYRLIWLFECLCARVCSCKQSKDRLACNSLLITVILAQLTAASIVVALILKKTPSKKLREERTIGRKRKLKTAGDGSRHFIDYRCRSHAEAPTLPLFPLCTHKKPTIASSRMQTSMCFLSSEYVHAPKMLWLLSHTYTQSKPLSPSIYLTQLYLSLHPSLIHTRVHNLLMPLQTVFAYSVITRSLKLSVLCLNR